MDKYMLSSFQGPLNYVDRKREWRYNRIVSIAGLRGNGTSFLILRWIYTIHSQVSLLVFFIIKSFPESLHGVFVIMYPPSQQGPSKPRHATADLSRRFTELYFGYASNLSPTAMKGRCPDSLFCGLARLDGWKWNINSTQYANIIPSEGDVVYGSLFFLSPRDEAGLDESEGVPWLYEKQWHEVMRIREDGSESGQVVKVLMYVDVQRPDEGEIMPDYVVWINKAIRDAKRFGLPDEYVEKYIRKYIPPTSTEEEQREIEMVRVMAPSTTIQT